MDLEVGIPSIMMIASVTVSEDNYQTINLNLHQGAIVRNRGSVMLGRHTLDIYLPIELKDYKDVLKKYFIFLQEAPTRLHLQILALKIMTTEEIQTQQYQNQIQNETTIEKTFLYPVRNVHPLLKAKSTIKEKWIGKKPMHN